MICMASAIITSFFLPMLLCSIMLHGPTVLVSMLTIVAMVFVQHIVTIVKPMSVAHTMRVEIVMRINIMIMPAKFIVSNTNVRTGPCFSNGLLLDCVLSYNARTLSFEECIPELLLISCSWFVLHSVMCVWLMAFHHLVSSMGVMVIEHSKLLRR